MDTKLKKALVRAGSLLWFFACVVGLVGGIGVTFANQEWILGTCVLALGAAAFPKVQSLICILKSVATNSDSIAETDLEPDIESDTSSDSEEG